MQKTPDGEGWISTSDPTRETLGTQLIKSEKEIAEYSQPQEVGETLSEIGKTICKGLEDAINNARDKGITGRIYIFVVEQPMPSVISERPVMQLVFVTRRTVPDMDWNTALYYHDDDDPCPTFVWALPSFQHVRYMFKNPHEFSPDQLQSIKDCMAQQGLVVL